MPLCQIIDLKKSYTAEKFAVDGLSLSIEKGDFFAFLGQNGAGKTTTIGMLTGLVQKTSGKIFIDGIDIDEDFPKAKQLIGVVPQEFNFFPFAKVLDIVLDQAGYYGIARDDAFPYAEFLLTKLALWDKKDSEARSLSGGMKRRLMVARGLIHKPKLLLLDEPTAGVDVELRRGMWDFLKELHQGGMTIVLTTHYLEEVEQLCNRLAIIANGKLVQEGNVKQLIAEYTQSRFVLLLSFVSDEMRAEIAHCSSLSWISDHELSLDISKYSSLMESLLELSFLHSALQSIRPQENALEELFLQS